MKLTLLLGVLCVVGTAQGEEELASFWKGQTKGTSRGHDTVEVHLKQGTLFTERQSADDEGQRHFYAFRGIPFAQPPVAHLRFKDPVPAGPWSQPRNGSFIPPECPQLARSFYTEGKLEVDGDEDCLYLNVFTPKPHVSANLPVMVWLHGGSFSYGNASFYRPLPLLTRDVVLVTPQFRLNTLGFLSTEDSVMPGNVGLKDQTLALRWVQENIRYLGGDPNRVTIFGESSGAASVHYQMLTPQAKGLFHGAILQSGAALCPWTLREGHREVAIKLGQLFNCSDSSSVNSSHLLACLQQVPFEQLTLAAQSTAVWLFTPSLMKPRVDRDYIPDHPATLLKQGRYNKVPLISGINQDEGADLALEILAAVPAAVKANLGFEVTGPLVLSFHDRDENPHYLAQRSFYHYLNQLEIKDDKVAQFKELVGDRTYNMCQDETSELHARDALETGHEVYRYKLRHRGQNSYADAFNNSISKPWVSHADELQYLFESTVAPFRPLERSDDLFVRDIMLTLWINFAATGKPTPTQSLGFRWSPMSQSGMDYLAIQTVPAMESDTKSKVREFFKNLPTFQNKILYPERFFGDQQLYTYY